MKKKGRERERGGLVDTRTVLNVLQHPHPHWRAHVRHRRQQIVVLSEDFADLLLLFGGVIVLQRRGGEKSLQIAASPARSRSAFTEHFGNRTFVR